MLWFVVVFFLIYRVIVSRDVLSFVVFCFVQAQLTRLEQELQQLRERERLGSSRSSAAGAPPGPSSSSAAEAAATGGARGVDTRVVSV